MSFIESIQQYKTITVDTAPMIYFIEAHERYGSLMRDFFALFPSTKHNLITSTLAITEVLIKPIQLHQHELVERFLYLLRTEHNLKLLDIDQELAHKAAEIRAKNSFLKTVDAVFLATAINTNSEAFLTNDIKLKQVSGLNLDILVLNDYTK